MKIAIGADHRGASALEQVERQLKHHGVEILHFPCDTQALCDYPDQAYPVAQAVAQGRADRGVLICGSGIGMSIAANKFPGVRAALAHDEISAEMSRRHNDANILCLSGDLIGPRVIERLVEVWLTTEFEGGRHARRVDKIQVIERGEDPRALAPPAPPASVPSTPTAG